MSEKVLHEWVDGGCRHRVVGGGRLGIAAEEFKDKGEEAPNDWRISTNPWADGTEIARLASRVAELEGETQRRSDQWVEAIGTLRSIGHAVGCEGDELAVLAAVRRMAGELATLKAHPDDLETTKLIAANAKIAKLVACVKAADSFFLAEDAMVNGTEDGAGKDLWLESLEHRNAYDAARAEVEP